MVFIVIAVFSLTRCHADVNCYLQHVVTQVYTSTFGVMTPDTNGIPVSCFVVSRANGLQINSFLSVLSKIIPRKCSENTTLS